MQTKTKVRILLPLLAALCFYLPSHAQWQLTGNRDANTLSLLGTTNGVPLRLGTKNLPRLFIDTTGNVGIGTVSPGYRLDVAGKVKIFDGTQGAGKVLTSDANGVATWTTPTTSPWTVSGNNLYNINTGNIGIGTTNPTFKLDINGDILVNGIKIGKGRGNISTNTLTGTAALDSNTTGSYNTANGYQALNFNTTGAKNTAVGATALAKNTTGIENTAVGAGALQKNTTGKNNTASGANALINNTSGGSNVATGDSALYANTTGGGNVAEGLAALKANTTGSRNTAVGPQAMLANTTGTNNTAVGYLANVGAANLTNATAIGANAKVSTSNSLVLGNAANVGIGTSSPAAKLDVIGKVKITDGSQAVGKVLTSDAAGLGTWQTAPGSMWTLSGTDAFYSFDGKVGIGTNTPSQKLELGNGGGIGFSGTNLNATDKKLYSPFDGDLEWMTHNGAGAHGFAVSNQGDRAVYLNSSGNSFLNGGNVGLGTVSPQQRLDINGNLHFSNADLPKSFMDEVGGTTPLFTMGLNFHESNINTAYPGAAYRLDSRQSGNPLHQWYSRQPNSSSEDMIMALNSNGGLSVGSTFSYFGAPENGASIQGDVGIGVVYPSYKLHVGGDIYGNVIRASGTNPFYFEDYGGGFYMTDNTWIRTYNDKSIWANYGLIGCNAGLTIGYGGDAPYYGGAKIKGYTLIEGGANITGGYTVISDVQDNSKGNVGIGAGGYNNYKLRVASTQYGGLEIDNSSGTVGIGVNGGAYKTGGGSWGGFSDSRLKQNVKAYTDGLDKLMKIKPVTYHYTKESGFSEKPEYVGVIAQELKEVTPYMVSPLVSPTDNKEYLSVDNSAMTYMLINAVKELKQQVDTKEAVITKQQEQLDKQQLQINGLLQRFNELEARQQECCARTMAEPQITQKQTTTLSSASLDQNVPNPPVSNTTTIGFNVPRGAAKAELVISDTHGKRIKQVSLPVQGRGSLKVDTKELASGTYSYSLLVDGKLIETKQMVIAGH